MRRVVAEAPAGRFEGVQDQRGSAWLGIRYASAERFGLPQAVDPVGPGSVDASLLGPACPQETMFGASSLGPTMSEDCLRLNIFSPAADQRSRPVMVWFHGGAFILGSAAIYDGSQLAELGDIVVVGVNYRLGALGFLAPEGEDMPTNLGIRDQIASLRWVRDNIASFGGDPDRVTIAGESAGSASVSLLMVAAEAQGLFHGAIMQSGAYNLIHDRDTAARGAERLITTLEPDRPSLDHLRSMPIERLLAGQEQIAADATDSMMAAPCFDGDLLPESLTAARQTPTPPVPLLAGANREESRLFEHGPLKGRLPLQFPALEGLLQAQLGDEHATQIRGAYPTDRAGERALATDLVFALPTRHFAQRHRAGGGPTWFYRFDFANRALGATHALELAYLWPLPRLFGAVTRGGPLLGRRGALADRMQHYWVRFVRTGDPGGSWPRFDSDDEAVMLFGPTDEVAHDPDGARRLAWAGADIAIAAPTETSTHA